MPFPDEPCAACPRVARGLPMPCRAMALKHARYCDRAGAGEAAVVAMLCGDDPGRATILARRAKNPRVPLGQKVPAKRGGG